MRAYVLINAKPGKVRDLAAAIAKLDGVRHASKSHGNALYRWIKSRRHSA